MEKLIGLSMILVSVAFYVMTISIITKRLFDVERRCDELEKRNHG